MDFGVELEDLKLSRSSIESIKSHAFKNVRGVRRMDLSENSISQIDNEAFAEVFALFQFEKYIQFYVIIYDTVLSDRAFINIVKNCARFCWLIYIVSIAIISSIDFIARA